MQRSRAIVIADDDRNDVALLAYSLKRAGIHKSIRWIKDDDGLIRYLCAHRDKMEKMPFLLVMDMNMPQLDVLKVLKWIRDQPCYLNLWVTLLTGSDDQAQRGRTLQGGANWYLKKTANCNDLIRLVKGLVELEGQSGSMA